MDADIVMQRYTEYLEAQAKRLDQILEVQRQRDEQQARIKAQWQARRKNEIHTCTKEDGYTCDCCGKHIPKGMQYRRQAIPTGYGFLEGTHFQTRITHLICSVKKEGEKV